MKIKNKCRPGYRGKKQRYAVFRAELNLKPKKPIKIVQHDSKDGKPRWWSNVDDKGYEYDIYITLLGQRAVIYITNYGVTIHRRKDKAVIATSITPNELFGKQKSLSWNQLNEIIKIIESNNFNGEFLSPKKMKELYKEWKEKNK